MQHNPYQLAPCNWSHEHFPWPPHGFQSGVCLCGDNRWRYVKLWILLASLTRPDSAPYLIKSPHKCCMLMMTNVLWGRRNEDWICFQGHIVDRFIYFPIQSLYVAETFGTLANSPSLFWGYCSNLVSQADKGIHLAANPFSDLDQVSEAHPFRSKYLCCLISKILPA